MNNFKQKEIKKMRYRTNEFLKEAIYTDKEMKELYDRAIDKHEYSEYDIWLIDMLRSGIFNIVA